MYSNGSQQQQQQLPPPNPPWLAFSLNNPIFSSIIPSIETNAFQLQNYQTHIIPPPPPPPLLAQIHPLSNLVPQIQPPSQLKMQTNHNSQFIQPLMLNQQFKSNTSNFNEVNNNNSNNNNDFNKKINNTFNYQQSQYPVQQNETQNKINEKKFIHNNNNRQHPYANNNNNNNTHNINQNNFNNNRLNNNNNNSNSNFKSKNFNQSNQQPQKIFRFEKVNPNNNNLSNPNNVKPPVIQKYELASQTTSKPQNATIKNIKPTEQLPSLLSLKLPPPSPTVFTQMQSQNINNKNDNNFNTHIINNATNNVNNNNNMMQPIQSLFPIINDHTHQHEIQNPPATCNKKHQIISIDTLLNKPVRDVRPSKISILLRGIPGSGKSYITNLIKMEEEKNGGSKPKILSIDNYFISEHEKETTSGPFQTKQIIMEYEYDKSMDDAYQRSLVKSFKKTVEDGLFDFIIVDMVNETLVHLEDMSSFAKSKGFHVYVLEMTNDLITCTNRNIHKRSFKEIYEILNKWEQLPFYFVKLDARSLLQDDAIENVEMGDACEENADDDNSEHTNNSKNNDELNEKPDSNDSSDSDDNQSSLPAKSRWESLEISEDKLNKLDGLTSSKRFKNNSDIQQISLKDYLESNRLEKNEDNKDNKTKKNRKQVRWKDFEEEKKAIKIKELGFIVGQSSDDWKKIIGNYKPSEDALKTYKYI